MTKDNKSKISLLGLIQKTIDDNYHALLAFDVADGKMTLKEYADKLRFYKI